MFPFRYFRHACSYLIDPHASKHTARYYGGSMSQYTFRNAISRDTCPIFPSNIPVHTIHCQLYNCLCPYFRPPPNGTQQALAACAAAESMAPTVSSGMTSRLNAAFAKNASHSKTKSGSTTVCEITGQIVHIIFL